MALILFSKSTFRPLETKQGGPEKITASTICGFGFFPEKYDLKCRPGK